MSKRTQATVAKTEEQAPVQSTTPAKVEKVQPTLSEDNASKLAQATTTSARIRFLSSIGWTKGQIAKHLGKRYQHVRNVLNTPLKKSAA
jgi:hypothetical protein